jgi:hypothetical protein
MSGGAGSDLFVFGDGEFGGSTASAADQVRDFSSAQGDRIDLRLVDADLTLDSNQAFAFIGTEAFSGTAGELRYRHVSGNTVVQGDVNGDGVADFSIRLDGLHSLNAADFML